MIWCFRPCKPYIFWKHITLAPSPALFWPSITKYRPVPSYTDPVPPSNNQYRPLPTKNNQLRISTATEYHLADLFSTWSHINSHQGSSLTRATCHFLFGFGNKLIPIIFLETHVQTLLRLLIWFWKFIQQTILKKIKMDLYQLLAPAPQDDKYHKSWAYFISFCSTQTWYLFKISHSQIFMLEVIHRKSA